MKRKLDEISRSPKIPVLQGGEDVNLSFGAGEGEFDVLKAGVVALDEVGLVAVHDPDELGQFGCQVQMKRLPKIGSGGVDRHDQVDDSTMGQAMSPSKKQGIIREGVSRSVDILPVELRPKIACSQ